MISKGLVIPGLISVSALLISCGGGGGGSSSSGDEPDEVQRASLSGAAVKGPLAYADVLLYQVDLTADDLKGELISSGSTDAASNVIDVEIDSTHSGEWVLIEFSSKDGTIDLNTGVAPLLSSLQSVTTADALLAGGTVYATPLTTLAVTLAIDNADSGNPYIGNGDTVISEAEFEHAISIAGSQVVSTFGFGLPSGFDIYTAIPLVTNATDTDEELADVVAYRQAVEGLAVVINDISTTLLSGGSSAEQVLDALASDLTDGEIDGQSSTGAVAAFSGVSSTSLQEKVTEDVSTKVIPGTTTTVGDIEALLVEETEDTGTTQSTTAISTGTVSSTPSAAKVESDIDGDGVPDSEDAFPEDPEEWQDSDNDGVGDNADAFPMDATEWADTDEDGYGDNGDSFPNDPTEWSDRDGDNVGDNSDVFPDDSSEWADTDKDGYGDNADAFPNDSSEWSDADGDGVGDNSDVFPDDSSEWADTDKDGYGDNSDTFPDDASEWADSDDDGVGDNKDAFPDDPNETKDTDGDGVGDNADAFPDNQGESADTDDDGIGDNADNCPSVSNKEQIDSDQDGIGDACDDDTTLQGGVWGSSNWDEANWQ